MRDGLRASGHNRGPYPETIDAQESRHRGRRIAGPDRGGRDCAGRPGRCQSLQARHRPRRGRSLPAHAVDRWRPRSDAFPSSGHHVAGHDLERARPPRGDGADRVGAGCRGRDAIAAKAAGRRSCGARWPRCEDRTEQGRSAEHCGLDRDRAAGLTPGAQDEGRLDARNASPPRSIAP